MAGCDGPTAGLNRNKTKKQGRRGWRSGNLTIHPHLYPFGLGAGITPAAARRSGAALVAGRTAEGIARLHQPGRRESGALRTPGSGAEGRCQYPAIYLLRLAGFALIIFAILRKNLARW